MLRFLCSSCNASHLRVARSARCRDFLLREKRSGGDEENRTPDPLLARQVLSQLSYTPKFFPHASQHLLRITPQAFACCNFIQIVRLRN